MSTICRYQKCLRQGMLKEGVRLDRVRGGRQKYRRFPMETLHTNRRITLEENKVLESLSQCEPEQLFSLADPSLPSSALKILSTLSDIYDRELVGTIGWAKQVNFKFEVYLPSALNSDPRCQDLQISLSMIR